MVGAAPATIYVEVNKKIAAMLGSASEYVDREAFEVRRITVEIEKLGRVNAAQASILRSHLAICSGDRDEAVRWARNASLLGMGTDGDECEMIAHSNLGYFSESTPPYLAISRVDTGTASLHLSKGLICAAFGALIESVDACRQANIELGTEQLQALEVAMNANAVLTRLGVAEPEVVAILDVAGEVLREHRLFWLGPQPRVHVLNDDEGASLVYEFTLGVSPSEANALADDVLSRIVERDLDRPGIAVSFASQSAPPAAQ